MKDSRTHGWQSGAIAARTLLALFVIFGLVVLFLPTSPLGNSGAQAQTSPSATGTRIAFINPSGATANTETSGPGREVSAATDDGNGYHLVAWVGSMPVNPSAEFKWQGTGTNDPETLIGSGTLRGTDTYDIFWNALPDDGTYNVKVILYSNGVEVHRDTEQVIVNNQDAETTGGPGPADIPLDENRGQAVEITYPTQAGPWGAFRKSGTNEPYKGVVDVARSAGTTGVRAYYTTSAPGNDPTWTRCSTADGESFAQSVNGVRCTLAAGVSPTSVTAIAAASGDANQTAEDGTCAAPPSPPDPPTCGEGEDSGDAHRAAGYAQVPSSMTITPATQTVPDDSNTTGTQFPCSNEIQATLLDQFGRKVVGANVDVHAAGPTDELYFDDPDATGTHKAPESNNHGPESSADCEDTGFPRALNATAGQGQGEHEVQGEGNNIKHIETTATGTNDSGQLPFRLLNRTSTPTPILGVTQFTAFYDRDDDDARCSAEVSGNGAIGWGTDPGSPTGTAAEKSTCPEPTPTPTGSPSPSTSPSASPSASRSASATPTSSASPGSTRTITLVASDASVQAGADVTLSGRIFSSVTSCTDNEFVQIKRRVHGEDAFTDLTSAQSASDGAFTVPLTVTRSADYQAVAPSHDNCATATSDPVTVLVKVNVSINVSEFQPQRGDRIAFTGKVSPDHDGSQVVLQRKKGGRWVRVAGDTLDGKSSYRIVIKAGWKKDRVFRVRWTATDEDHESNNSQKVKVTTHK